MSIKYRLLRAVIALIQRVDPYILREAAVPERITRRVILPREVKA